MKASFKLHHPQENSVAVTVMIDNEHTVLSLYDGVNIMGYVLHGAPESLDMSGIISLLDKQIDQITCFINNIYYVADAWKKVETIIMLLKYGGLPTIKQNISFSIK